jgi:hypothetical protein
MSSTYEVRIRGRLSSALRGEFEQLGLVAAVDPAETLLHGPVVDQAALYGLVRRLEALGLELVELRRLRGGDGPDPHGSAPPEGPGDPGPDGAP